MIGGGARKTGAGARPLSIDMDRNTLLVLVEFGTVVGDCTDDAGICMLGARLPDVTATCGVAAAAAAAEFSPTAADEGDDDDVTLAAASRFPLSDVNFCAFDDAEVCVENDVSVIDRCAPVKPCSGIDVVAFDR